MGDVVDLNSFRKYRERMRAKRRAAASNRLKLAGEKEEPAPLPDEADRGEEEKEGNPLD